MGSLGLNGKTVRSEQLARHHTQATEALCKNITLHITVVVLACPDEATRALQRLRNHVVDETVLVVDTRSLEVRLVRRLIDVLEDILEATVILLQDSVLCRHEERHLLGQRHLEG